MGAERNSNFFNRKALAEAKTPFACDEKRFDFSIFHPQAEEKEVSNTASISLFKYHYFNLPPAFS